MRLHGKRREFRKPEGGKIPGREDLDHIRKILYRNMVLADPGWHQQERTESAKGRGWGCEDLDPQL